MVSRVLVVAFSFYANYRLVLCTKFHEGSSVTVSSITVMPFHTCGPNEAMVVSGNLLCLLGLVIILRQPSHTAAVWGLPNKT